MINFKILKAVDEKYYKDMLNIVIQSPDQKQADNLERQILLNKKESGIYAKSTEKLACDYYILEGEHKQLKSGIEKLILFHSEKSSVPQFSHEDILGELQIIFKELLEVKEGN